MIRDTSEGEDEQLWREGGRSVVESHIFCGFEREETQRSHDLIMLISKF
jgi:hypothetical protein